MILSAYPIAAQVVGLGGGISLPNSNLNRIYNTGTLNIDGDLIGRFAGESTGIGFHVAAKIMFGLGDDVDFAASIGLHRFAESNLVLEDFETGVPLAEIATIQNIVPIASGIEYTIFRKILGLYIKAEIQYNLFFNTTDLGAATEGFSLENEPSFSRVGTGIGIGADLDLGVAALDVSLTRNQANFIGRRSDEPVKNYFSVTAMVLFGDK